MKKTQNARLLEYLKTHKRGITQLEAFIELGICRLSERIRELEASHCRDAWEPMHRKRVKVPTRQGGQVTVTRYSLNA